MFVLKHQDGDIEFETKKGGFAEVDSKLYLSVETQVIGEDAFPDCYMFVLDGFPLDGSLENSNIDISTNPNDEPPNVYVYTTFHACEVKADLTIKVLSEDEISVKLNVISEDVNYYNEKAKSNLFTGEVNLQRKAIGEMWIPS
ncbi:hypothetical protein [Pleionea mediterranea]|uniref:Uncharacterized protein n=1 Tax=Pleionea mediterranea TaxID=523701 RepID=A0A316FE67_9GAMM|nr:hypothetical protein [Pleionea mediterranea]PWK45330.1 hypothetical protein C8D97_1143 [Pleionea mediterranea]